MQDDSQDVIVDGVTYRMRMLDPWVALDISNDLGQILAPALGALAGYGMTEKGDAMGKLLEGGEENEKIDPAIFQSGIIETIRGMDKAKVRELMGALIGVTAVVQDKGVPELSGIAQVHFRGRTAHMYKFMAAALKVQFADFFTSLGPLISQFAATVGRA